MTMQSKIRERMKARREAFDSIERHHKSLIITDKIVRADFFQRATRIACYIPTAVEVDTWPVFLRAWRMKKRIFAPTITNCDAIQFREVSANSDLLRNEFGIFEPVDGEIADARAFDIVITPLVAFDDSGHRVGMGGGYYDRAFSFLGQRRHFFKPKLIGAAFEFQKTGKIAANPWDIRVFRTVTESTQ